jgi:hypothetical protein
LKQAIATLKEQPAMKDWAHCNIDFRYAVNHPKAVDRSTLHEMQATVLPTGLQNRGQDFLADRPEMRARNLHMYMIPKMHERGHCRSVLDRFDGPPF